MKFKVIFILCCLASFGLRSQIIINEISYNPPESGQDSLEYIELYNTSINNISMKDWVIDDAVNMIFPDTILKGYEYLVICVNQAAFESVFKFKAIQWDAGALRNTSELISLKDQNGNIVDSVRFMNNSGWPTASDGKGPSLELCRSTVDNAKSEYWKSSTSNVGVKINTYDVKGTPGKANNVACADVTIDVRDFSFNPPTIEILVGQHIEWKNSAGKHNVNGLKATFPTNPDDFYSGVPMTGTWNYIKRFDIEGDYNYRDDANPNIMLGKIKVRKIDPLYPSYPIGIIRSTNPDGIVDSLNVRCTLEGIVHGINFRPSGLQFTMIDNYGDGIVVFSNTKNFSYTVKEGDKVRVKGLINQFNGLAQVVPDTMDLLNPNNPLSPVLAVTSLNENTESQLVKLRNVYLVAPIQWTNNPLGFTVKVSDGTNSFDVRIDNDCDLVGKEAPAGKFDISGLGYQNDITSPYTEGYQLYPRYTTDINPYVPQNKFYNKLDIGKVRTVKSTGELDSLKIRCELRGTVYGIDYDGSPGIQFTLIDKTGGISVFNSQKNLNYKVTEGDEIIVQGVIDQFMGQAEIIPDTIILQSIKNQLKSPRVVVNLDESVESDLIKLNNVSIVDVAEWIGNGSSFNVRLTDGTKEFIMRIDNDCELSKTMAKGKKVDVTGIGNQFDNTNPFNEGYQIWPRYNSDINFISAVTESEKEGLHVIPNPAKDWLELINHSNNYSYYRFLSVEGKTILSGSLLSGKIEFHTEPGIYILELTGRDGRTCVKVMVD